MSRRKVVKLTIKYLKYRCANIFVVQLFFFRRLDFDQTARSEEEAARLIRRRTGSGKYSVENINRKIIFMLKIRCV